MGLSRNQSYFSAPSISGRTKQDDTSPALLRICIAKMLGKLLHVYLFPTYYSHMFWTLT